MKNGKKPTIAQKKAMTHAGLDSTRWLVVRVLSKTRTLEIVHRRTRELKIINQLEWT